MRRADQSEVAAAWRPREDSSKARVKRGAVARGAAATAVLAQWRALETFPADNSASARSVRTRKSC